MIIYYIGEMICGKIVSTFVKNLVIKNRRIHNNFSAYQVIYTDFPVGFYPEPHHILRAAVYKGFDLLVRHGQ